MTQGHLRPSRAVARQERPVLPAGGLRRTGRLAALPLRHAARTAAAATRLSRVAAERLAVELLHPMVATAAADTFTYSRPWLRGLMAHFTEPRFGPRCAT